MHNKDLSVFMQTIGYDFKDISLLEVALTHSSYANEQKKGNCCDNERMEFLGDAVLELSSSDYIYKNHSEMAEGKMTRLVPALYVSLHLLYVQELLSLIHL